MLYYNVQFNTTALAFGYSRNIQTLFKVSQVYFLYGHSNGTYAMYGYMVNCDSMRKQRFFSTTLGLAMHKYSWDFVEERAQAVDCIQIIMLMVLRGRIWKYMKKNVQCFKMTFNVEKFLLLK